MPVSALPDRLPIFPLDGVLLLPRGSLPLNVFEPRYIAMVDAALRSDRMIGIIQPRGPGAVLFSTGCAGRITTFTETDDGRYEITLKGICRFHMTGEFPLDAGGFRIAAADWSPFARDVDCVDSLNIDRVRLKSLLRSYFDMEGMDCSWDAIDGATDDRLITCLSMVCPLDSGEKQALLEAGCGKIRADLFMTILEMAIHDTARRRPDTARCH